MLNNIGVKMGALGVAVLLWLHVVTEKTYTHTFNASLEPAHLTEHLIVANELPEHLQVRVKGKGKRLLWLAFSDMKIILDLQDTIQSKKRFRIKASDVVIPRDLDVTVVEVVEPDYVDVDIDRSVVKRIPVHPRLKVSAAEEYVVVGPVKATPDSAAVSGPRRFVEHIDTLFSLPANVQRAKRRVNRNLSLVRPEGTNVTITPTKVVAELDVQKRKRRVVSNIPVILLHVPSYKNMKPNPATITLTVEGGTDILASLTSEDFLVSIDCSQAPSGSAEELTPVILTPPDVTWIDAQPRTFRIVDSGS